ncbi:MAG: PAS domain S-box protein [Chloroflexi bacterium]|nr:MAG: PAS domain S-box protein [Chloroflexota bacterium]
MRDTAKRAPSHKAPTVEPDQFRLLVESVRDYAIFLLDPDGNIISWNAGAERINGYHADEIIGRHFSIFYPAADARRGKPEYELRIATEEGRYEEEGWRVRKDGSLFWASVDITALRDEKQRLVGFAKVTRDLTERRQAEEAQLALLASERGARTELEATLARMRTILSITETALGSLDLDHLLRASLDKIADELVVDTAAVLLLSEDGSTLVARAAHGLEEEVQAGVRIPVGQGFAGRIAAERKPVVLDDVAHSDVLNPILREKGIRSLVGVPLLADGRVLGVLHVGTLTATAFNEADVQFLELIAARIASAIEHARLYEAAHEARSAAAEATEALHVRDEFLSAAAHELKTPLTASKIAVQLLARSLKTALTPSQQRSLGMIEVQIARQARLVSHLLESVRLGKGELELELEEADVAALVRSAVELFEMMSDKHQLTLRGPQSLMAHVDALRFEQVVMNLLDNAVKYSPKGGAVEVTLARTPSTFVLSVRDHGVGVAPEHLPQIFDRFYQAHRNRSGLGLGLYISRQIVERHGGTVYAEAPPDGGTRFVVSMSLAATPRSSSEPPASLS